MRRPPARTQLPTPAGPAWAEDAGANGVVDVAIVAAAQAVEHYEIIRYGTLIAWGEEMTIKQSLAS